MGFDSRDSIEWEATLVVCAEHPDAIMRKIGEITFVDEYRLLPQPSKLIRDVYFDTVDGALASAKWALRVREIGKQQWITLKGPSSSADSGGVRRMEVELSWSAAALEKVMDELSAHGLHPGAGAKVPADLSSRKALHALGFRIIQDRETERRVRDIFSPQRNRVAEMVLDTVAYHITTAQILHEEIEIEAKAPSGSTAVSIILDYLMREFGSHVRPWDVGKLATGLALERLLEKGGVSDLIASDGHLTPAAYGRLAISMR